MTAARNVGGFAPPRSHANQCARSHNGRARSTFHPLLQKWAEHFDWHDGATVFVGKTATGRATIAARRMNRTAIVALRNYWIAIEKGVLPEGSG